MFAWKAYGSRRNDGADKKVYSSGNERCYPGSGPAQHRDGWQAERGPEPQRKVTDPQAWYMQAPEEIDTITELQVPSKQRNCEDPKVARELTSGRFSTETSNSKVTPSVDIEGKLQENSNLEQKFSSSAGEELDDAASLVSETRSVSPPHACDQAASNSSYKSIDVIKMKLEFRQKQFEFKEKLAHERAMRETELKWNLDYNRAQEKLQEKEAELQRLRQKNSRDTFLFDGITEKSPAEKHPEERRDQPAKNKIQDLIIEIKSLEEDDNPETLAFVDLLSNHVRLHKKMIRYQKGSQKADCPKETKPATVGPVLKAEDTPKQPNVDKKQEREADTKAFTSLPAPVPMSTSSIPSITSVSPLITIFPIQVLVVGQAFGSDQQFLNQVEKHLEQSEVFLQKEPFTPSSDGLLLLFCPVVSRAGTDISNALEKSPAEAKIILVVMNHVPNESMTVYLDSRSKVQRRSVIHSVDCRFSERSGLYTSQMNNDAVTSVARKIQEEAKARS
ncbi:hypothetical protein NDU88_010962 [Pleurodeles waltl]|uniref:Uncharacterized protein n=1 Tax=Pleurodeles waltl TaxID=8319 RepID=A0AAV7S411_PLEWA|nr:hypothetical protein NDU88_010962 [Pleurodeles waltl]